jgi:hypothetical protein
MCQCSRHASCSHLVARAEPIGPARFPFVRARRPTRTAPIRRTRTLPVAGERVVSAAAQQRSATRGAKRLRLGLQSCPDRRSAGATARCPTARQRRSRSMRRRRHAKKRAARQDDAHRPTRPSARKQRTRDGQRPHQHQPPENPARISPQPSLTAGPRPRNRHTVRALRHNRKATDPTPSNAGSVPPATVPACISGVDGHPGC